MLKIKNREPNSTIIWTETERGRFTITSYVRVTKSKGVKNILLLSNDTEMAFLGVTKDDGFKKTALFKLYDFLKGGTDISGNNQI